MNRGWLRHGNPAGDPSQAPRCGARTRTDQPCRAPAVRGKQRCRMHGGRSTGPRTASGSERVRAPVGRMAGIRPSGNASSSGGRRNTRRSMRARRRSGPGWSRPPRPYSVWRRKPPETRGDAASGGRSDCGGSNGPCARLGCVKPRRDWRLGRQTRPRRAITSSEGRDEGHSPVHQVSACRRREDSERSRRPLKTAALLAGTPIIPLGRPPTESEGP